MNEKEFGINDAFPVWWYFTWRTAIVFILLGIGSSITIALLNLVDPLSKSILNTGVLIVSIIATVYFLSKAINRDYKNFRLSAIPKK